MKPVFVYITAKDKEQAVTIAKAIVTGRLAACANIIDGVRSIYRWKGKIADTAETVIIAKTRKKLLGDLIARVKSLHTYKCPCIVAMPIIDGYGPFLEWIGQETGGKKSAK